MFRFFPRRQHVRLTTYLSTGILPALPRCAMNRGRLFRIIVSTPGQPSFREASPPPPVPWRLDPWRLGPWRFNYVLCSTVLCHAWQVGFNAAVFPIISRPNFFLLTHFHSLLFFIPFPSFVCIHTTP
ncbi:hypothetical protein F5B18DRAFT_74558 [Nemania serpens]|nr:hypothetical protein F5B18DRAFT_74558 [Nemania serpens]